MLDLKLPWAWVDVLIRKKGLCWNFLEAKLKKQDFTEFNRKLIIIEMNILFNGHDIFFKAMFIQKKTCLLQRKIEPKLQILSDTCPLSHQTVSFSL